jgi:D-psicose/D-tagatose/L-ribulose 3-epimerase
MSAAAGGGWELSLIDSAWAGSKHEGTAGLALAAELGFEAVDLFVGFHPGELTAQERASYLTGVRDCGVPALGVICTCLGLSDFNPSVREYHIRRACSVVDLGAELATVRTLLFVPGDYIFGGKLLPAAQEWDRVVDATRRVGAHAASRGLEVAIELLPFEHAFVRTLDELDRLLRDVGLANVKAGIDISHLWLERIDPSELSRFAGRVGQVHIADCDGFAHGDLPVGRGNTPFVEYLRVLGTLGYRGSASVELEFPTNPEAIVDWVREARDGALGVLVESGLRTDLGSSGA